MKRASIVGAGMVWHHVLVMGMQQDGYDSCWWSNHGEQCGGNLDVQDKYTAPPVAPKDG